MGVTKRKVLVTGHDGYIGAVLIPMLREHGHDVVGLDNYLFEDCTFGSPGTPVPAIRKDVRDVEPADLEEFDAVIHLAGLCNDPLGDLNPECTFDINHRASVRLAEVAKRAGVERFLFSSSCSLYGAAGDTLVDEDGVPNPVTPYGASKVKVEEDVSAMADDGFSPTFLRNATVYGVSPRLRGDLVVNNLVGYAYTTGQVHIKSDGTPWRPLVHVADCSRAFVALLHASREIVHNEAFNVGITAENYQVRQVADIVKDVVPGSEITYAEDAGPDKRNYRVSFDKLATTVPDFRPTWTVRAGVEELLAAYRSVGLTYEEFVGPRLMRIAHILKLLEKQRLDPSLRWRPATPRREPAGV
jgi:nucleoside-diphosphate-sugar epimerase